jgi:hypothetical protein
VSGILIASLCRTATPISVQFNYKHDWFDWVIDNNGTGLIHDDVPAVLAGKFKGKPEDRVEGRQV